MPSTGVPKCISLVGRLMAALHVELGSKSCPYPVLLMCNCFGLPVPYLRLVRKIPTLDGEETGNVSNYFGNAW